MKNVIVCAEPYGAEAGREIFRRGGNAVDAAIAAAFAQGVTNPLGVGIGGDAILLGWNAATKSVFIIDGCVAIPSGASPEAFGYDSSQSRAPSRSETVGRHHVEGDINQYGYKSIMIPGFVRGVGEAFRRYGSGRVPWSELVQPAIRYAHDGFKVYPYLAEYYTFEGPSRPGYPDLSTKLRAFPETAKLIYKDGRQFRSGETMIFTDMANTLRAIAEGGPDEFYSGKIGQTIAQDMQRNGGFITHQDLQSYEAPLRQAVRGTYRGHEIVSTPPPDRGVTIIQMLNILESYDLKSIGWNTPEYIDLFARTQRCSFADAAAYLFDPDYNPVPTAMLLSKEHAAEWRKKIQLSQDQGETSPNAYPHAHNTTNVTAVDAQGNMVSCTHSIGSVGASAVITPGLGFIYNNFLGHFNPVPGYPNSIRPGLRGVGGDPVIVLRDGKPFLIIGSSGGSRLVSAIAQSIINVIDFGMGMAEAVAVPRFHCETDRTLFAEPTIFSEVLRDVERRGYQVNRSNYMGCNQAVRIDPESGRPEGGTDPRGGRGIAYWS